MRFGIPDPRGEAEAAHKASKAATAHLTEAVKVYFVCDVGKHALHMKDARNTARTEKDKSHEDELNVLLTRLGPRKQLKDCHASKGGQRPCVLDRHAASTQGKVLNFVTEFRFAKPLQFMELQRARG
jgi:hypothetical protein